jgi:hypothetical protein
MKNQKKSQPHGGPQARATREVFRQVLLILLVTACATLPTAPRRVTLVADGQQRVIETESATVRDVLQEAHVEPVGLDRVTPPETAALTDGMAITVTRVLQHTEVLTETLPFGRQVVRDASVPEGESRLLEAGQAGVLERVYRITLEDGVETERVLVREATSQAPRDEVVLIGTRPQVQTVTLSGTLVYLNNQDAWGMRGSNRGRRRITALGDLDGRVFDLSPDGAWLLFTRAVTATAHINELWLINTVQADAPPIPLNVNALLWAQWAPDGKRIAWTTAEPTDQPPGWRGQNDLWVASLSERNTLVSRRKVLEPESGGGYGWWGARYAWSPTGDALAYTRPESVGVVDLKKPERTQLVAFPAYRTYSSWAWNPAITWSPAGDFIATTVHGASPGNTDPEESPVFNLWLFEATGAYSAELASEVGMWSTPHFSPDGETLLFGRATIPYQSDISPYTLCTLDRDGSNQRCFYPPEGEPGVEVPVWRWSPDGQEIAFLRLGDVYLLPAAAPLTDEGGIMVIDWR